MKLSAIRRYRKKHKLFGKVREIKRNPVMLLGISLPFAIATAISLKNAVALSIEFFTINMAAAVVLVLTANKLPYLARAVVSVGISTFVMMAARNFVTWMMPDISNYLGTYLYLMALSGMVTLEASGPRKKGRIRFGTAMKKSVGRALGSSAAFAALMLVVSAHREYLGNGSLWGHSLPIKLRLSGMLMPFYGFICVGFLMAFIKFICKKIDAFGARESERAETHEKENYSRVEIEN